MIGERREDVPDAAGRQGAASGVAGADVVISLLVAFNFAVSGPVLEFLARNLEVFTTRSAPRTDIIALILVLTLGIPLVVGLAVRGLYAVRRRIGAVAHGVVLAGLLALLFAQLLERVDARLASWPAVLVVGAVAGGAAAATWYFRSAGVRSFARLGVIAPAGFAALFALFTPANSLLATAEASGGVPVGDRAPIAIVVFDGLPVVSLMDGDGDIDATLFPNFARLAEEATWFRNATTPSSSTRSAMPAMLTGDYPGQGSAVAADYPDNLFTLLGPGYRTVAYEPVSRLCPEEICAVVHRSQPWAQRWSALTRDVGLLTLHAVLPSSFRGRLPPPEEAVGELAGGQPRNDPEDEDGHEEAWDWFLEELVPDRRPGLHYFHWLKPHYPWHSLPSGQHAYPPPAEPHGGYVFGVWEEDWANIAQWQRQLLQTGYADHLLGQFLDQLEEAGLHDDALVIVASDHGEAFTPGTQTRIPWPDNLGELAFVTLFVKEPSQDQGRTVDEPVELVDVFPTILDVLDARTAKESDGTSLLGPLHSDRDRQIEGWDAREAISSAGEELAAAVERKEEVFGSTGGWERVFRVGPHADLVGREVGDIRMGRELDARIRLLESQRLRDVDPDARRLPVLLAGRLRAQTTLDEPTHLAVAVNGRIAAVVETYRHDDRSTRMFAVLPQEALRRGNNDVEVYAVDDDGGDAPRLRPIATIDA